MRQQSRASEDVRVARQSVCREAVFWMGVVQGSQRSLETQRPAGGRSMCEEHHGRQQGLRGA